MRSPIARFLGERRPDELELRAMRAAAWRKQGIAVLRAEDISDEFVRRLLIQEIERLYGKREAVR